MHFWNGLRATISRAGLMIECGVKVRPFRWLAAKHVVTSSVTRALGSDPDLHGRDDRRGGFNAVST